MGNFIKWLESNSSFETVIANSKFTDMTAMAVYADYLDEHTKEHETAILLRNPLNYVGLIVREDSTKIETALYSLAPTIAEEINGYGLNNRPLFGYINASSNKNTINFSFHEVGGSVGNSKIKIYYYRKKLDTQKGWRLNVVKSGIQPMPDLLTNLLLSSAKTYTEQDLSKLYHDEE
jgi:hypothetical protein